MDPVRSNNGPRYKHLADEPAPYDTITVDKLTPIIGGEIGGVDLSRPLGNRTLEQLLLDQGRISPEDLRKVRRLQQERGERLERLLLDLGFIS